MSQRRYVVIGGGAVGGVVAAQLSLHGHPVVLVARGEQGSEEDKTDARALIRDEAAAVLEAAGVRLPPGGVLDHGELTISIQPVGGHDRGKSSTWQSVTRGVSNEIDFLHGEIALPARKHGLAAPYAEETGPKEALVPAINLAPLVGARGRPLAAALPGRSPRQASPTWDPELRLLREQADHARRRGRRRAQLRLDTSRMKGRYVAPPDRIQHPRLLYLRRRASGRFA
jgi:choline dehydrogenase-like flavoprotein